MSVRQRIASALAANAFGQAVTIGTQVLLTPLYFSRWGPQLYGEWLILSAIPAYLTMADLGIGSAAGNEMIMRAGSGDHAGAQRTYRGAFWIALWASLCVLFIGALMAAIKWGVNVPGTPSISAPSGALILLLLALNIGLSFYGSVLSAGYRCAGRNATGTVLANMGRLVEGLVTGLVLIWGLGPLAVCIGMLLVKSSFLVVQAWHLRRICSWLYTPRVDADRSLARRLLKPSLAFLAMPLAIALSMQGPIMVIGAYLGGGVVAMFSAMRTLSRIPIQLTAVLNASVWPEMSLAYGGGNLDVVRRLHRRSARIAFIFVVGACLVLAALGDYITRFWLGSLHQYDPSLLYWLLAIATVTSLWNASSIVLSSTNAHGRMGLAMILTSGFGLILGGAVILTMGINGFMASLFCAEITMCLVVLPQALSRSEDRLRPFLLG